MIVACLRRLVCICLLICFGAPGAAQAETRWPRWRGPQGDGQSAERQLPVEWTAADVAWKTELPGRGQSSPIVWDERIFLTAANEDGSRRSVLCLDRTDGKIVWQKTIDFHGEAEELHKMNTWATPSCATDGQVVIAFFGRAGLHAFTIEGEPLWSKDLGPFENPWGTAASPVLVGELAIQNGDADAGAFIAAYDKRTGAQVWRQPRPNNRGWSTPVLIRSGDRDELVLNGDTAVTAYDPATGKQLWFCKSFNGRGEPTATPGHGLVYLVNGKAGDVYAVRPGGEGDVTGSRMAWHTPRRVGRDLPSPIVIGKYVVVAGMQGVAVCYDAEQGTVVWQDRLGGNYSASPIAAAGLAYFLAEDGTTLVLEPAPEMKIVARNKLETSGDEIFRASPAVCEGQLLLRSDRALYCVGRRQQD